MASVPAPFISRAGSVTASAEKKVPRFHRDGAEGLRVAFNPLRLRR